MDITGPIEVEVVQFIVFEFMLQHQEIRLAAAAGHELWQGCLSLIWSPNGNQLNTKTNQLKKLKKSEKV